MEKDTFTVEDMKTIIQQEELDEYVKLVNNPNELRERYSACIKKIGDTGYYRLYTLNERGIMAHMLFRSEAQAYANLVILMRKVKEEWEKTGHKPHQTH